MNPATPTAQPPNVLVDAKTLMTWAKDGRKLVMLDCRFELSDPGRARRPMPHAILRRLLRPPGS